MNLTISFLQVAGNDFQGKRPWNAGQLFSFPMGFSFESKRSKSPNFEKILEIAHKNELTDLVVPYLHTPNRSNLEAYKKTADQLNKGAIQAKEAGIRLSYHNHAFEFQPLSGGKTGFDVLTRNFSEDMFLN